MNFIGSNFRDKLCVQNSARMKFLYLFCVFMNSTEEIFNRTKENKNEENEIGLAFMALFASVILITLTLFVIIFVVWKYGVTYTKSVNLRYVSSSRRFSHSVVQNNVRNNYSTKVNQFSEVLSNIDRSNFNRRQNSEKIISRSNSFGEKVISNTLQKKLLSDLKDFQLIKDNNK
uniref:1.E7.3 n=1 Tax=Schmidtea mediterranea TaxID=79327 RepID=V9XRT1_SCHMD|nr:1.E7.3 [Schmidtea mediterranea]